MPGFTHFKLLEACREPGCPFCRLEQEGVERYLENQFYENVNSPPWRSQLRASLGFCREHAWLMVDQRLGDALGSSIIYHDLLNSILKQWSEPARAARRKPLLGQMTESLRNRTAQILATLTPRKACPACEHLAQVRRDLLSAFLAGWRAGEMQDAFQVSSGWCWKM